MGLVRSVQLIMWAFCGAVGGGGGESTDGGSHSGLGGLAAFDWIEVPFCSPC